MPTKSIVKKTSQKKVISKKTPVKKVSSKKPAPNSGAKKILTYASNSNSFWVSDGQVLNSLVALENAFVSMSADTFAHHVNKEKNDFAQWVDAVLGDSECATLLQKTKTKTAARTVVKNQLTLYVS